MGAPTRVHGSFPGTATYQWGTSASVASVWAAYLVVSAPELSTDWDTVALSVTKLPSNSFAVPLPADGELTLVQLEPRYADYAPGLVKRITIAATPQLPAIELDDIQNANVGTQWWKVTERGIGVTSVQVQTQTGPTTYSGWGSPTRSAGAASVVRGGLLGVGEYEHDITLALHLGVAQDVWIMPRLNLASSSLPPMALGPFQFIGEPFMILTASAALASYAANTITVTYTHNGRLSGASYVTLYGDDGSGSGVYLNLASETVPLSGSITYTSAHNLDAAGAPRTFSFYLQGWAVFGLWKEGVSAGYCSVSILSL